MSERAKITAKTPETKRGDSIYHTRNINLTKPLSLPIDHIMHLQRTIGNQAVQRLFKSGAIHAKLRIGQPYDVYEQEADRVAEQVMSMPEPHLQRQAEEEEEEEDLIQTTPLAEQITPLVQRQVEEEEEKEPIQTKLLSAESSTLQRQENEEGEEEEYIQPKAENSHSQKITPDLEPRIQSLKGGGQPLPESVRAFFEPRFGFDFSHVRLHNDAGVAETARAVNAKAFTIGKDIVFGAGQYQPVTESGKRLLAHELVHVVQQTNKSATSLSAGPIKKMIKLIPLLCTPLSGRNQFPLIQQVSLKPERVSQQQTQKSQQARRQTVRRRRLEKRFNLREFFKDLNLVLKSISKKGVKNISIEDYDFLKPDEFARRIKEDSAFVDTYEKILNVASGFCEANPTDEQCINGKPSDQYVDKLIKFFTQKIIKVGGLTSPDPEAQIIIQLEPSIQPNQLLEIIIHEGIHKLAGRAWHKRRFTAAGIPHGGIRLSHISTELDEAVTSLITSKVMEVMQGKGWFRGYSLEQVMMDSTVALSVLMLGNKGDDFLVDAYFEDSKFDKVDDLNLWYHELFLGVESPKLDILKRKKLREIVAKERMETIFSIFSQLEEDLNLVLKEEEIRIIRDAFLNRMIGYSDQELFKAQEKLLAYKPDTSGQEQLRGVLKRVIEDILRHRMKKRIIPEWLYPYKKEWTRRPMRH